MPNKNQTYKQKPYTHAYPSHTNTHTKVYQGIHAYLPTLTTAFTIILFITQTPYHTPPIQNTHLITPQQHLHQNKYSKLTPHPTVNHHSKLNYPLKSNPHSIYKHFPKNTTASASRPRHTNDSTFNPINKWKLNSITNQITRNNTNLHLSPRQVENTIPAIPNLFTTTKFTIVIYLKTNKKKPKILHFNGYYFINTLGLLRCGDIELNPGPMPTILHTHPTTHKKEPPYSEHYKTTT